MLSPVLQSMEMEEPKLGRDSTPPFQDESGSEYFDSDDRQTSFSSDDSGQGESPFYESDTDDKLTVLDPDHPVLKRYQTALEVQLIRERDILDEKLREISIARQQYEQYEKVVEKELGIAEKGVLAEKGEITKTKQRLDEAEKETTELLVHLKQVQEQVEMLEEEEVVTKKQEKQRQDYIGKLGDEEFKIKLLLKYYESEALSLKKQISRDPKQRVEKFYELTTLLTGKLEADIDTVNGDIEQLEDRTLKSEEMYGLTVRELRAIKGQLDEVSLKNRQLLTTWKAGISALRMKEEKLGEVKEKAIVLEDEIMNKEEKEMYLEEESNRVQKETRNFALETNILIKKSKDMENIRKQIHDKTVEVEKTMEEVKKVIDEKVKVKVGEEQEAQAIRKKNEKQLEKLCIIHARSSNLQNELIAVSKLISYDNVNTRNESKYLEELKMKGINLELECARIENIYSRLQLQAENIDEEKRKNVKLLKYVENELAQASQEASDANQKYLNTIRELTLKESELERLKKAYDELKLKMEERKEGEGPRRLRNAQAELASLTNDCTVLQEAWLAAQTHMMKLETEKERLTNERNEYEEKSHILDQKRVTMNKLTEQKLKDMSNLEKGLNSIRDNLLTITEFICSTDETTEHALAILERELLESIDKLQKTVLSQRNDLNNFEQEKAELKSQIFDNDRLSKLWSSRLKEATNTRHMLLYEQGDCSELAALKEAIHRLEVEKLKLIRSSEEISKELEKYVSRRTFLVGKADLRNGKPEPSLQARDKLLKNDIDNLRLVINRSDSEIEQLQAKHSELRNAAEARRERFTANTSQIENLRMAINSIAAEKSKNIRQLSLLQRRYKLFADALDKTKLRELPRSDEVKTDKYTPSNVIIEKLAKVSAEVSDLANRVGTAIRENPAMANSLRPVLDLLLEPY